MKKIAVYATLFILLFNIMGHFIVFKSMQMTVRHEIKKRIKEQLPASELTVIRLADHDEAMKDRMNWVEGNEFRMDGRMYDVVRTEHSGDTTLYYCINDTQEERLFANLDKQVKQQDENNTTSGQKRVNLLKILVHEAIASEKVNIEFQEIPGILSGKDSMNINGITPAPPSPPPKA